MLGSGKTWGAGKENREVSTDETTGQQGCQRWTRACCVCAHALIYMWSCLQTESREERHPSRPGSFLPDFILKTLGSMQLSFLLCPDSSLKNLAWSYQNPAHQTISLLQARIVSNALTAKYLPLRVLFFLKLCSFLFCNNSRVTKS